MAKKSKKRKQEQGTGAFQNSPFTALKGVIGNSSARLAVAPKPAPQEAPEDEEGLFLRSVSGARRIAAENEQEPGPRMAPAVSEMRDDNDEASGQALFLQALGAVGTAGFQDEPADQEEDAPARSTSSRMRQLRRGTLRISEELDLHGFLKDEALRRLEHFIASAAARGLEAVLVITGKGHNSPEGPVLPGAVDAWLRDRGKGMVAEFHAAPRDKGGSGAQVVFLKRRPG
jgi:DNA-nicking Smr family endonuclease